MKYCVIVSCSPELPTSRSALLFCQALEKSTHELYRVFFHSQGTLHADAGNEMATNWLQFKNADIVCCAASVDRHFGSDSIGRKRQIHKEFAIAGLGQLIEAESSCDRIVSFGQETDAH